MFMERNVINSQNKQKKITLEQVALNKSSLLLKIKMYNTQSVQLFR